MNSTVLPSFQFGMNSKCFAAARLTWPVGNVKIALPEKIAILLHPHVDVPWTLVVKGIGKAKSHFGGIFKSFKSIMSGVIQPLGDFFHVVG